MWLSRVEETVGRHRKASSSMRQSTPHAETAQPASVDRWAMMASEYAAADESVGAQGDASK